MLACCASILTPQELNVNVRYICDCLEDRFQNDL